MQRSTTVILTDSEGKYTGRDSDCGEMLHFVQHHTLSWTGDASLATANPNVIRSQGVRWVRY